VHWPGHMSWPLHQQTEHQFHGAMQSTSTCNQPGSGKTVSVLPAVQQQGRVSEAKALLLWPA
jgi:hypothetical protein